VPCPPARADGRQCHIAFSLGNGTTIEARSTAVGVVVASTNFRSFTLGALVPGAHYAKPPVPVPPSPTPPTPTPAPPTPTPTPPPPTPPTPGPSGSHAPRTDKPYLKRPMAGSDAVREMQRLLIQLGLGQLAATGATGNFYALTEDAVRIFQRLVHDRYDSTMTVDGECGPVTWGWLEYLTGHG
jgi:hypothetical protein